MNKPAAALRRALYRLAGVAVLAGFCLSPAQAQLKMTVIGGQENALPVAVVPFGWSGPGTMPFDVAAVIDADLARSGRFAPLARADMLERPTTGSEVDFDDWTQFRAEVVVVGKLERESEGQYRVIFQVMDVPRRQQLLGYTLTAAEGDLRAIAHYISDVIYESLTGVPGVFSTRIAYVSAEPNRKRPFALIVADADGENQREIVRSEGPIMSPAWSPDGSQMAYVVFENNAAVIYVQDIAAGQRRKVSSRPGVNGAPSFSPDGQKLALTLSDINGNLDVFVLDLQSGDLQQISAHPAIDTEPSWSPEGHTLYYNSDRSGGPQIYAASPQGGPGKRLTFQGSYNARPRVSPDGDKIAIVHIDHGNYRIAVVDADSGDTLVLSKGRLDESPSFAPNGSTIIYAAQDRNRGVLETVSVDGKVRQRLASEGRDVREPVWGPMNDTRLEARQRN